MTEPVETPEDASDAKLRAWARENGIEGVPGKRTPLSTEWREGITNAMTAALNPKAEDSAGVTSSEPSASPETTTEPLSGEKTSEPVVEYRSVFQAPNTFVSSQAYTA